MAQPRLKALFFVNGQGTCFPKAPPLTVLQKRAVFERDGKTCRYCGRQTKFGGLYQWNPWDGVLPSQVDHITPRARGGQNTPENLQLLCQPCNSQKGNKTQSEFTQYTNSISGARGVENGAH